mmetsp:Transcript_16085/g.53939  ORF Transcript_16085/g.53939 Transcript_16085/m.53939 type:complete len:355 (-) Transcript_16085:1619-2683(-)
MSAFFNFLNQETALEARLQVRNGQLRLRACGLTSVPPMAFEISQLSLMDLSRNKLTVIPNVLVLTCERTLKSLFLDHNFIVSLPPEVCNCIALEDLRINSNQISLLPPELGNLRSLTRLDASMNRLTSIPSSISQLDELRILDVSRNLLPSLPDESLACLTSMSDLSLSSNRLDQLPLTLAFMQDLKFLRANGNRISQLKRDIVLLPELTELHLSDNLLTSLPSNCWLKATNLEALDVCGNQLSSVPPEIGELTSLQVLGLARNANLSEGMTKEDFDLSLTVNLITRGFLRLCSKAFTPPSNTSEGSNQKEGRRERDRTKRKLMKRRRKFQESNDMSSKSRKRRRRGSNSSLRT